MAEILSQSQIDALLEIAREGNISDKKSDTQQQKYKTYDFYSPKKFTKDRLKLLNSVYENYARMVSSNLNGLLRINNEVALLSVEEQRYYEFMNALSEHEALAVLNAKLPGDQEGEPILFHTSNQLVLHMADRMLGGKDPDYSESETAYTEIELALYESILNYIVPVMRESWAPYLDVSFQYDKMEVNPSLVQTIGMDEIIVIVVLEVTIQKMKGQINICLPANLLTKVFGSFERNKTTGTKNKVNDANTEEEIFTEIKNTPLMVTVKLGDTQILLTDLYRMQVGDVINLNKPKDSEVYLYIQDQPWFTGQLGMVNKNVAVKINGIYEQ